MIDKSVGDWCVYPTFEEYQPVYGRGEKYFGVRGRHFVAIIDYLTFRRFSTLFFGHFLFFWSTRWYSPLWWQIKTNSVTPIPTAAFGVPASEPILRNGTAVDLLSVCFIFVWPRGEAESSGLRGGGRGVSGLWVGLYGRGYKTGVQFSSFVHTLYSSTCLLLFFFSCSEGVRRERASSIETDQLFPLFVPRVFRCANRNLGLIIIVFHPSRVLIRLKQKSR